MVKYLVEKGLNNHRNNELPLRTAVEYGHEDVIKYLVSQGADIH